MKIRRIIQVLVLAAALVVTLIPLISFGDEQPVTPESAAFSGGLGGLPGDMDVEGLNSESSSIEVTYSDGSTKNYVFQFYQANNENQDFENEGVDAVWEAGFVWDDAKADLKDPLSHVYAYVDDLDADGNELFPLKEGANGVVIIIEVPYETVDTDGNPTVEFKTLTTNYKLWITINRPTAVEFVPAEGFTVSGFIGDNTLDESAFYGEGNKFVVTETYMDDPEVVTPPEGSIEVEYLYTKEETSEGVVEGFYNSGNIEFDRFDLPQGLYCFLNKGLNENVNFEYEAYNPGQEEPEILPFTANVQADRYNVLQWDIPIYAYTGKVVKNVKFKLYTSDDQLIPAKDYTISTPKAKKMGWYTVKVTFKDKTKYVDSIDGSYGIGPKAPVIKSVKSGKKKLTVNWKKPTKKQLKNIGGMYIEVARDKHFFSGYKLVKLSKKDAAKGTAVVKGLAKGKKYYVRVSYFKKINQNGKFLMPSADSKTLTKKTK